LRVAASSILTLAARRRATSDQLSLFESSVSDDLLIPDEIIEQLARLAQTHDGPTIREVIALLNSLGGDDISVGDISDAQAVAIGRGARAIVNNYTIWDKGTVFVEG
jgi:hypothetical protein